MVKGSRLRKQKSLKHKRSVVGLQPIEIGPLPELEPEMEVEQFQQQAPKSKKPAAPAKEMTRTENLVLPEENYGFSSLNLCAPTMTAIEKFGFTRMTEVQARTIPPLLGGKDVIAAAKTGSGKTLAFLIPVIEKLMKKPCRTGVGAIVISPTRELALQIYQQLTILLESNEKLEAALSIGGSDRRQEAKRIVHGVDIVVGTPGRLLDHLNNTEGFNYTGVELLIVDEADRILEIGFEEELKAIVRLLPTKRQSLLFSATQTAKVAEISKVVTMSDDMLYIGVDDKQEFATRDTLEQGYVVVGSENKLRLLYTFLKKNALKKKVIIFFATCAEVQFYYELLKFVDLPVLQLHGKLKQGKRTNTFFQFTEATSGALLCTDVAARGLDIPHVDWIIQFDPPEDPKEYIHRVGRTARGVAGAKGRALMFLLPQEVSYIAILRHARVPLKEYEFPPNKLAKVQPQLEKLVEQNYYLHRSAREAFRSYIQGYSQHARKDVFDVHALDLISVAKSFGFEHPPRVDLKISLKGKKSRKEGRGRSKNGFSAENPYGNGGSQTQWSK